MGEGDIDLVVCIERTQNVWDVRCLVPFPSYIISESLLTSVYHSPIFRMLKLKEIICRSQVANAKPDGLI